MSLKNAGTAQGRPPGGIQANDGHANARGDMRENPACPGTKGTTMTRRTPQHSFANRATCIVFSALLAITMMPVSAFAAMGEYVDPVADVQQQPASEFVDSENQAQQEQPSDESMGSG